MKATTKLPFIIASLAAAMSTSLPYVDMSLVGRTEGMDNLANFFGIKPVAGYLLEIGIAIGIVMLIIILITLLARTKAVVVWTNMIASGLVLIALIYYSIYIGYMPSGENSLQQLIMEKVLSIKIGFGIYVTIAIVSINILFCFILNFTNRNNTPIKHDVVTTKNQTNWTKQLEELSDLKDKGIISVKEYLNEKNEVLRERERYANQQVVNQMNQEKKQNRDSVLWIKFICALVGVIIIIIISFFLYNHLKSSTGAVKFFQMQQ